MTGCRNQLPGWPSVLAVVAHPDDESFSLGAVLAAFAARGAAVSVLCFTRGEASTVHGVPGDLAAVRAAELAAAARALGIGEVTLVGYPTGGSTRSRSASWPATSSRRPNRPAPSA